MSVRMTQAQLGMDASIRSQYLAPHSEKPTTAQAKFKLRRFIEDAQPKVSTVRGEDPYALHKLVKH